MSKTERKHCVIKSHPRLSLSKQCNLLNISRSGMYYKPKGESHLNLRLMREIDECFMEHPYYGVERMTVYLNKDLGHRINPKRIRRLYRKMGLETIFCRPRTTLRNEAHYKYPYLLKNMNITRPNQVWQTDISYIPMFRGYMYLAAIIDVYSRKIVGWDISNTMTKEWVNDLLVDTIRRHGKPEIHNSDQGSQYTSDLYIQTLKENEIKISMAGKGRALDNIYIERFWRAIKYEKLYLNPPNGGLDLHHKIHQYVQFYNQSRRHSEIDWHVPEQMFMKNKRA